MQPPSINSRVAGVGCSGWLDAFVFILYFFFFGAKGDSLYFLFFSLAFSEIKSETFPQGSGIIF
jgi:hypothetical protein